MERQAGLIGDGATLRDYLQVVRRRRLVALVALVLAPLAATAYSLRQEELYQASAEVLLSRQNLAATLTGTQDATLSIGADRVTDTQARLARVPEVARRALAGVGLPAGLRGDFLERSSVATATNTDILVFTVTDGDPVLAQRLATSYAKAFTAYRRELDTAAIDRARAEVRRAIAELGEEGQRDGALHASLVDKEQQLSTLEALQTSNAFVVREADSAPQVQPRTLRNGMLGLVLGLGLAVVLAFLREALDTRVRTAEEISERLGLPLLARLPAPPKRVQKARQLSMVVEPAGAQAEAFRMLRTNLDFVRLDRDVRTILVTSAVEQEGKSTTAANLAVALARAGQRVVLVDLDLRRPFVARFFGTGASPGVTQVVLGHVELPRALRPVPVTIDRPRRRLDERLDAVRIPDADEPGSLHVLGAGALPPDPGEFVASRRLERVLRELRERADVVVVDAPPILHVGDAMILSTRVDAILLVARLNMVRRPMLGEMRRLLESSPARVLGFVATGAGADFDYGYAYTNGYVMAGPPPPSRPREDAGVAEIA